MIFDLDPSFHMVAALGLTGLAIISFAWERISLEATCLFLLVAMLLFGQFFPLMGPDGKTNLLDARFLLAGFANPSLIAVLCLLVMGQGVLQTDALRPVTRVIVLKNLSRAWISVIGVLIFVALVSAVMNNTPLVILAIPVMQMLSAELNVSDSRLLMPLSFAAILGGMLTLIGSSTNLLVASAMEEQGYTPLGFFDFTVPGLVMASVGLVYVIVMLPRFLPDRSSLARQLVDEQKEFIAEIEAGPDSQLIGCECVEGRFALLPDMNVRLVQRSGHLILPPFEGYMIEEGDNLIVSATRGALADILSKYPGFLLSEAQDRMLSEKEPNAGAATGEAEAGIKTRRLGEVMVTPGSRLIDLSVEQAGFDRIYGIIVLGIQRRAQVVRRRLGRVRLEAGDVLLVAGNAKAIDALRDSQDLVLLSGSKMDLSTPAKAPLAVGIFVAVVALAACGIVSIPVAAASGVGAMLLTGCLNMRQAMRAVDRKIFLLVGTMLGLGTMLEATGGATWVALKMLDLPFSHIPLVLASMLFIIVALATNVLTNNACAILFTPIALSLAATAGIDPRIFAITVLFAANCSFASPIGYQTNLLVMGPGHYKFRDFIRAGVPLVLIMWVTYIFLAAFYYGL